MKRPMRTRRLFSSFAGSVVVAALMGCNAIVGTEDIDYRDDPTEENPEGPPDEADGGPDAGDADADARSKRDGDADLDGDAMFEDGPTGDGGAFDASSD